jgi:hypothetical protein
MQKVAHRIEQTISKRKEEEVKNKRNIFDARLKLFIAES